MTLALSVTLKKMSFKILVITPVTHIKNVPEVLQSIGEVTFFDDPSLDQVLEIISGYDAIYTNPNKSKVFIGRELLDKASNLKVICTASTGTNHIDVSYAKEINIPILSLTEERRVINQISSTAELAFSLTLASLRHVVKSHKAVLDGEWDYEKYIGRQMNSLTIGVIGYGRLGSIYTKYCNAFDAEVIAYDPFKKINDQSVDQVHQLDELFERSNIIAIHVHVTEETIGMINKTCFEKMNSDVIIVNTSRGDIVNESDLVSFLKANQEARIATDVLANEIMNREDSPLLEYAKSSDSDQVIITPHIGGMSVEAQEIAYAHAANRLKIFFKGLEIL